MFDIIAVSLATNVVRIIAENKTERNAEAIVNMAVMRRGTSEEFFTEVPAGSCQNGDKFGEKFAAKPMTDAPST